MAETKTTLMRLGGRALARLIKHVESSSQIVFEPADLRARLRTTHPCIVATWHGQFMMTACLHPGDIRVAAMVARHGDAELIGAAMEELNTELIRGAGAGDRKRDRGGAAALRASVKALSDGASLVMTADIPPGPARIAGLGIIMIARMSGCPIVPVASATKRFKSFDTWSRMTVNLPYSKLAFTGDDPIHVPRDANSEVMETKRVELEIALNAAMARAYELAGASLERATPTHVLAARNPPRPGIALKIYQVGMSLARPAVPLLLNARGKKGKEDLRRRGERLGFAGMPRPTGPLIWVHAASVGETNAVLPLIDDILAADATINVLLTTGTTTSADLAQRRLPPRAFHQYVPLDVPQYAARFLDHWQPGLAIFTESDIWPNLVLAASAREVPLVLVNARMSPRSQKRWRKNGRVGRALFSRFKTVLAQNAGVARTLKRLGAPNVITAGNLKIDAPAPPVDDLELAKLRTVIAGRPVFLAASTHPGEDEIVAAAHAILRERQSSMLTIIVPRHPNRGAEIAADLQVRGYSVARRSLGAQPQADTDIYIADTIGELGTFYALAPIAFIGGSLIPHGGQNAIEAVRLGTCVLSGPEVHNFRDAYDALLAQNGTAVVRNAEELAQAVERLSNNAADKQRMQAGAERALSELGGARARTMAALAPDLARLKS